MRNRFSGRRRYALACLVAVAGLVTAAAQCAPPKPPPKEQPPTTIFSIDPPDWDFGLAASQKTFTVTNNGENTSGTVDTVTSGTHEDQFEVASAGVANTCVGTTLDPNESCEVEVAFNPTGPDGPREADLVVSSNNPDDGEARAPLFGQA